MRHLITAAAAATAIILAGLAPAAAGNLFATAAVGIDDGDLTSPGDWSDSAGGAFSLGWDFGTAQLAAQYNVNQGAEDTVFVVGGLRFGKGDFRPGIGAGIGAPVDDFGDPLVQVSAGAMYSLTDNLAITADYRWIAEAGDFGDGGGQVLAGLRVDF